MYLFHACVALVLHLFYNCVTLATLFDISAAFVLHLRCTSAAASLQPKRNLAEQR